MITNNLFPVLFREQIIKSIREFFYRKDFQEAIIPVLNTSLPLEQNIYPFKTTWNNLKGNKDFYLTTSPEAYLKKMIVKGTGNCFGIGHSFRNMEGDGPLHNPEFLMLEWYRENADYRKIMGECRELILIILLSLRGAKRRGNLLRMQARTSREISRLSGIPPYGGDLHFGRDDIIGKWPVLSIVDLFEKYARLNLSEIIDDKCFIKKAKDKGYQIKDKTWEQIFNQIFLNEIEPHLTKKPFFLIDYPAKISPLCANRKDKPYLAERFELYINGIEIANGNTENTDYKSVLKDFKVEGERRKKNREVCPPIDMEFIQALRKMQGKSYAGIGMGIDRLAMVMGQIDDITELI